MTTTFALIPARGGSVRVPRKNARLLGGKPLITWTIEAAQNAGLDGIFVSTDDEEIAAQATAAGAIVIDRPSQYATAESPDIDWLQHALAWLRAHELAPDVLAILRPTSPFRGPDEIRWAQQILVAHPDAHSVRAMRIAREHPAKVWEGDIAHGQMAPAWIGYRFSGLTPEHSRPTQTLPLMYVQTGGLEIVHRHIVEETDTISGINVYGMLLEGPAGLDINTEADWAEAERIAAESLLAGGRGEHA